MTESKGTTATMDHGNNKLSKNGIPSSRSNSGGCSADSDQHRAMSIAEVFEQVLHWLDERPMGRTFQGALSNEEQLQLYGLYKQSRSGKCNEGAPSVWNIREYYKHEAWKKCCHFTQTQAKEQYVRLVVGLAQEIDNLGDFVVQCQDLLERVTEVVEPEYENSSEQGVRSTNPSTDCCHRSTITTTRTHLLSGIWFSFWEGIGTMFRFLIIHIVGIRPMLCRGQIDISNTDLWYAAWQCLQTFHPVQERRKYRHYESKIVQMWKKTLLGQKMPPELLQQQQQHDPSVIVGLSVRTLLDLYLRMKQYPAGSEIIISPPINVPGIMQVLKHHQLTMVAVDLPESTKDSVMVAVDCVAIEKAVTDKTVAIMVVHVFGMIATNNDDMKRLHAIATTSNGRSIDLIEDCAESFVGMDAKSCDTYLGSPYADISLFSFGLIKTATSLNGGIAIVRSNKSTNVALVKEMIRLHRSDCYEPQQSNKAFLWKVCQCYIFHSIASSPTLYGILFFCIDQLFQMDFDRLVTSLLRGFRLDDISPTRISASGKILDSPTSLIYQIRRRPSPAMLALLYRRLCESTSGSEYVTKKIQSCQSLSKTLLRDRVAISSNLIIPTERESGTNCFWLYPVIVENPMALAHHLRRSGFDATKGATQLRCVADVENICPRAYRMMHGILYLPASVSTDELDRLSSCLKAYFNKEDKETGQPSKIRYFNSTIFPVLVLLPIFIAILLPWLSRQVLMKVLVFGIKSLCCFYFVRTTVFWFLRYYMGDFYINSSKGFAKYNFLLDEQPYIHQKETNERMNMQHSTSDSSVLSSMISLTIPSNLNDTAELRSVFLTGGTGFVGSMLLHDLLYYRKELRLHKIILLCRARRGKSANDRIVEALNDPMYSFMTMDEKLSMINVVEGDTTMTGAGILEDDVQRFRETLNVTHVFHCAASVSFTQSIKDAGASNIGSSLNVQSLSQRLRNTNVQFVHISTAFVHGKLCGEKYDPLPEQLYSFGKFDPVEIYKSMCGTQFYAYKAMTEHQFPNTYTFSKSVCEHLLMRNDPNTLIIRPSIVGPAVESPQVGWAGKSPTTIVAALCLYLSYQYNLWSFRKERVPCIPVDVLTRYIIAKALCCSSSDECHIPPSPIPEDTSSDDSSFEKVSVGSSFTGARLSRTSSTSSLGQRIHTAAWDVESPESASFTWLDFVGTCAQVGVTMGYYGLPSSLFAVFMAGRFMPNLSLSIRQFEKFHYCCVWYPFQIALRGCDAFGIDTRLMKRLQSFLDLPLLFFPFTNNRFYFHSDLIAPIQFDGEKYLFSCVAAAHRFMTKLGTKANDKMNGNTSFFRIAGSAASRKPCDLSWALTQPLGNFATRVVGWLLSKILWVCYSEVTVDLGSFAASVAVSDSTWTLLAPTHRSFFDFLLMSYLSFALPEMQISTPIVAAAEEFESLPFVGGILPYLGAFFIRRGRLVRDPALMETIVYAKKQKNGSGTIEVFVEGTRSRDRRFVKPKTGVLKSLHDAGGNYTIVPIAISHERIAEQEVLTNEAAGGARKSLSFSSMMSWILHAFKGEIHLGRVHISACAPISLNEDDPEPNWDALVRKIQQCQAEGMLVSDYHIEAASSVLDIETDVVKKAFKALNVKLFPRYKTVHSVPQAPLNECESLSLLFQASPYFSPLLRSTNPDWSDFLSSPSCVEPNDEILNDPAVTLVTASLCRLFDAADKSVEAAMLRLKQNGFIRPKPDHVLQESLRNEGYCPASLLKASIAQKLTPSDLPIVRSSTVISKKRVGSEESLGFWGFYDSTFVVRADKNGQPFVSLDGSRYALRDKKISKLLTFIEHELHIKIDPLNEAFSNSAELTSMCSLCSLSKKDIKCLMTVVASVSTVAEERIRHGTGHCQEDIFHIRSRTVLRVPDVIAWPESAKEVVDVVAMAQTKQWCIVPFGGGTNVTQATRCPPIEIEPRPIISLDMKKMDKIIWIDEENCVANVEAGITGRCLEEGLASRGYMMGHEPDSIEFSTLGGWIATKASGMKRTKYGNIEDIVVSMCVAGPNGVLHHGQKDGHRWGRESCGIDLRSLIFGSEGCLGVVTSAVVRIWPIPEVKDYDSILLPDFEDGLRFVKEVSKLGGKLPASIRLLDNEHFRLGISLRSESSSLLGKFLKEGLSMLVKWRHGLETTRVVCATILYEGSFPEIAEQKRAINEIASRHGGVRLGSEVGKSGYELTFMIAYLRDFAMTYHVLGESFETFVSWSNVEVVIEKTKARILKEHSSRHLPGKPFVGCRVTQLYHEGACLYFYFCMSFENVENASAVYSEIEHAARAEVMAYGGSVSHHHGIGKIRSSFLKEIDSIPLQDAMNALKNGIDPDNIFGARNGSFAS